MAKEGVTPAGRGYEAQQRLVRRLAAVCERYALPSEGAHFPHAHDTDHLTLQPAAGAFPTDNRGHHAGGYLLEAWLALRMRGNLDQPAFLRISHRKRPKLLAGSPEYAPGQSVDEHGDLGFDRLNDLGGGERFHTLLSQGQAMAAIVGIAAQHYVVGVHEFGCRTGCYAVVDAKETADRSDVAKSGVCASQDKLLNRRQRLFVEHDDVERDGEQRERHLAEADEVEARPRLVASNDGRVNHGTARHAVTASSRLRSTPLPKSPHTLRSGTACRSGATSQS